MIYLMNLILKSKMVYINYQKLFDEDNHEKLKIFLEKMYKKGIKWLKSNYYRFRNGFILQL